MSGTEAEPDAVVDHVVQAITTRHPELDGETVEHLAREEHAKLAGNPVQDYVEVLTEHAVKRRLHDG
ncbi:three-helix bundle dimerization domain-containing protein [Agrococcus sp. SGAir0287]|uniref:three-helix bundle dimerization domain-containing protein n=1 Tax=Agrococcus sp. SGAir0287 TaxID=2070347 RepID=UPI0010CCB3D0|nr:hypothetical protein [Agrococcus sp. SGAir0287]QCR20453.1 hypothetical protein C1N71_14225 [Agrococcus sp. SGAir0287]